MPIRININGVITPPEEARIPVLDHGFLFGDSIYESLRTYDGMPFLFSRHYIRLERSARGLSLELPGTREATLNEVQRTLKEAANPGESRIRLIITRGVGELTPSLETCTGPSVIIIVSPLKMLPPDVYAQGVDVIISSYTRGGQLSDLKTGNLILQVLANREASTANAFEAILTTPEGHLSDGITSNIFMVQSGKILTPSREANILEGITRGVVMELARKMGLEIVEGMFERKWISLAEEMFLTSTTREVVPIVRVDGTAVGNGRPGPIALKLLEAYRLETRRLVREN